MTHSILRFTLASIATILSAQAAVAHPIDSVLAQIERNNLTLKALGKSNEAEIIAGKSANNLGETSIDYSPFYADGVSGVASSELVVSQSFDFPTLYAARSKANDIKKEELRHAYNLTRRDILLDARTTCLALILTGKKEKVLAQRMDIADKLLTLYEKKTEQGEATIIELNKVKMERMELAAEQQQLKADMQTLLTALTALNGNKPVQFAATDYPSAPAQTDYALMAEQYTANSGEVVAADSRVKSAAQNVNISRQNWLPKLTVGYRRNTNLDEAVNGFLVGAAIPLFSNRHKTKEAKVMHESMVYELEEKKAQSQTTAQSIIAELRHTEEALKVYDLPLMESTQPLLGKAVQAGEISIIDYFRESDIINANIIKYLELEHKYHTLISEIRKNEIVLY